MKYMVRKSIIEVVGQIWQNAITCAYRYTLTPQDVENCHDENGKITRESVAEWLSTHSGDFQHVDDFFASLEDGEETIEIAWENEDSELTYDDCTCQE